MTTFFPETTSLSATGFWSSRDLSSTYRVASGRLSPTLTITILPCSLPSVLKATRLLRRLVRVARLRRVLLCAAAVGSERVLVRSRDAVGARVGKDVAASILL